MEFSWFFGRTRYRRKVKPSVAPAGLEKEVQETFSGSWQIYRIAFHEKGGLDIASEFLADKKSGRVLFDLLEYLDVYDALKEQALQKQKNNKQK